MLGVNDMAKRKSKKNKYKKMKKILLGVLIGYAVLLLGAYFIGVFYYSKHFYPGSTEWIVREKPWKKQKNL